MARLMASVETKGGLIYEMMRGRKEGTALQEILDRDADASWYVKASPS